MGGILRHLTGVAVTGGVDEILIGLFAVRRIVVAAHDSRAIVFAFQLADNLHRLCRLQGADVVILRAQVGGNHDIPGAVHLGLKHAPGHGLGRLVISV